MPVELEHAASRDSSEAAVRKLEGRRGVAMVDGF
jgi:hypothetical protein